MSGNCGLCGGSRFGLRFREQSYRVVQCLDCHLVQVHPRPSPSELTEIYSHSYFRSLSAQHRGYQDYVGEAKNYLRTFRRRYELIRRFLRPGGAILEVGCACGFFLSVLRENGWSNLHAVDISQYAVDQARKLLGTAIDLRVGVLADQTFDCRFDAVFLWDVVEHLVDPSQELKLIHRLLRPGGYLILETQNVDSWLAVAAGRRWHMYKFPEHLYHFNRQTISSLLHRNGFTVAAISYAAAGKYLSGAFIEERVSRYSPPLRRFVTPLHDRLRHIYVNLGDEMIVTARRRN